MIIANINDFINGWFIGNFEPTLLKTENFEVAHHFYKKEFRSVPHMHKVATEYNYIISGKVRIDEKILWRGDMFIYEPGDVSDVVFLEDTDLLIIKTPSLPNDKYLINTIK